MNKHLGMAAFAVGLATVAWVSHGYIGANPLALTITALIAAFYIAGAVELQRFRHATTTLHRALTALPPNLPQLDPWLRTLHPSLQQAVRLRVEGERVALPAPALTPYLVGLLVLLGMLGTFLGMVVTLNGAVMALESTTDLPAMRAALAAPVKGLGLAFGTSVAGVAASAALGLMSALARRDRVLAAQALDERAATTLRHHSLAHQREQTLDALQQQSRALPEVVAQLHHTLAQMAQHSESLNERLLASQDRFFEHAERAYGQLASSVDRSLTHSLSESARAAGAVLQPAVQATMQAIAQETATFQRQMADSVQRQLDGIAARFDGSVTTVADRWTDALAQHQRTSDRLSADLQAALTGLLARQEQQQAAVLAALDAAHATLRQDLAAGDTQRLAAWQGSLERMAGTLQAAWQQEGERAQAQQTRICATLEETAREIQQQADGHARATIAEMSRLIDTASEAPRAAAEVVGQLRDKLSDSLARDNTLLDERNRLLATLSTLLDAVNQAATEQRAAIDALVATSADMLQRAGAQFGDTVHAESVRIGDAATQLAGSAVEVASLGEAFGAAVQAFGTTSESLTAQLQRIEAALDQSSTRSDEQLAYYVAQARELIDLSLSSQKQIVDDLQRLAARQPLPDAAEA